MRKNEPPWLCLPRLLSVPPLPAPLLVVLGLLLISLPPDTAFCLLNPQPRPPGPCENLFWGSPCQHLRFHDIDPWYSSPPDFFLIFLLIYIRKLSTYKSFWMFFSVYSLHLIILQPCLFSPSVTRSLLPCRCCSLGPSAVLCWLLTTASQPGLSFSRTLLLPPTQLADRGSLNDHISVLKLLGFPKYI